MKMATFDDGVQHIDFGSFEEMDPSLADGYRIIYDREVLLKSECFCLKFVEIRFDHAGALGSEKSTTTG